MRLVFKKDILVRMDEAINAALLQGKAIAYIELTHAEEAEYVAYLRRLDARWHPERKRLSYMGFDIAVRD